MTRRNLIFLALTVLAVLVLSVGCASRKPSVKATPTPSAQTLQLEQLSADIRVLEGKVSTMESKLVSIQTAPDFTKDVAALKLADVAGQSSDQKAATDIASLQIQIDAIKVELAKLTAAVAGLYPK